MTDADHVVPGGWAGRRRTNWAGNHTYRAARLHRPQTVEQLREIVVHATHIRVLGTRHSFNDIADSDELVSLDRLPVDLAVDRDAATVSFNPRLTYGELAPLLAEHGLALANLASLPHISVAGAVNTATHGSGDANGNLATAVAELELVTSDGALVTLRRGERDFDGAVVGLGALGALTRIALDVQPAYEVSQRVFEGLSWDALLTHFDAITSAGYSVSAFCRWGPAVDQVWVKTRAETPPADMSGIESGASPAASAGDLFGARAASVERHPILGLDPVNCTPQLGVVGPWSERLPHFRLGFTPSSGDELQSEFLLARADAVDAIRAVRTLSDILAPLTQVSEIRTVAADQLWMSPQYGRDTVGIHFTWFAQPMAVQRALSAVEEVLAPFGARPHWGKVFLARAQEIAPLYPRLADFRALTTRLDPRGAFHNGWLSERVLGTRGG